MLVWLCSNNSHSKYVWIYVKLYIAIVVVVVVIVAREKQINLLSIINKRKRKPLSNPKLIVLFQVQAKKKKKIK